MRSGARAVLGAGDIPPEHDTALRIYMKLSDPDFLKTAEPLYIYDRDSGWRLTVQELS
jgi:hypothetical protein